MADWSEWEETLLAAMIADATFAAMLADGAESFLQQGQPDNGRYPLAVWTTVRRGSCPLDLSGGKYRPQISISFFADSPYVARDVAEYASQKFRIPSADFSNQLTSTNWRIDSLICEDMMNGGVVRDLNDGSKIYEVVTDWQALVVQIPA